MAAKKFYVVWHGRNTGIFETWEECNAQIKGFPGASFKSFTSLAMAQQAFVGDREEYLGRNTTAVRNISEEERALIGEPVAEAICVDAAWNTFTKEMEYRGVELKSGIELFRAGPFAEATINTGEFLAIVHGLSYCRTKQLSAPVYSDSRNAIAWVRDVEARTDLERTEANKKLFQWMDRALQWLKENPGHNTVLKWETGAWGENPADFGRK